MYSARNAAYELAKLIGKTLVRRMERSRRYAADPPGARTVCVPTSSYARTSSSRYWMASSVPVAGHSKSPSPRIIITLRCAKSSIEPLKPLAWRSPEQQTGARVSRQHVAVRASIRGLRPLRYVSLRLY
jgi:hypothetical protein